MDTAHVIEALQRLPLHPYDDVAPRAEGPPPAGGLYAWWQTAGALPGVPGLRPHTGDPGWELLYVGIAPRGPSSRGTLRRRLASHHGASIGRSTFRMTLTALLWKREDWSPSWTDRPTLAPQDLAALAAWQREHLAVQWVEHPQPWAVEREVIEAMCPPLNRDHNRGHPAHTAVGLARATLRQAAQANAA
ncbi:MAG: GIY-YIG nuclease family protein [Solirubrobacteraceae bacterium]